MTLTSSLVASLHYLALGLGFFGIAFRGVGLKDALVGMSPEKAKRIFLADNFWGVAALLWLASGLFRAFGDIEKGSSYYLSNHFFWGKMLLFGSIGLIEVKPMVTLIKWRRAL
ncbi:MAG: DUF2214 family protein [Bdellovibrionales bacterium]|nr:DUF2214 family protein [Bdellovibrionales bacterium]